MSSDTPDYLTPPEVARLLRVRETKVLAWIREGRLPAINLSEGKRPRFRVRRADLDEYLTTRAVTPPPRPAPRRWRQIPQHV